MPRRPTFLIASPQSSAALRRAFDGRVIKQIGDAFMLVFQDARPRRLSLEIDAEASKEPQFPAIRGGIRGATSSTAKAITSAPT